MISVFRGEAYLALISRSSLLMRARSFASRVQDAPQLLDELHQAQVLGLDLAALQARQLVEPQLEDGVRLALRERVLRHQPHLGLVAVGRGADDLHEVVEVIERDDVALEDVGAVLGLAQPEPRAAGHHVAAVLDVALDQLLDVHLLRALAVEREQRDAERGLERRLLEELVDDDLRLLAALQLDDDAGVLVRLVAQVADAVELLLRHELGDARHQVRPVHVVGDLRDHDLLHAPLHLLRVGLAAQADDALAGLQVGEDRLAPRDDAARRKVRPADDLAELVHRHRGPVEDRARGVDDLAQVVRGDVGRHADGDPRRAVHQEVRQRGGQDRGLGRRLLVVGGEVDRLLLDVLQELLGGLVEAALGVAVGRRRVAVDRAEVPLGVDERVAHDPGLGQAHQRVVHGRVPVGVVVLQDLAHHARALVEGPVVDEPLAQHRVEDPPLDRLQAVPGVGKGARDDDRHRVVDVGRLHDVGDVGRQEFFGACVQGIGEGVKGCGPGFRRPGTARSGRCPR